MANFHNPRILIDHSGYHLKNLGDVAMLQAAVTRIQRILPTASIQAICVDETRLKKLLPGVEPISDQIPLIAQQSRIFPIPHKLIPSQLLPKVLNRDKVHRIVKCSDWASKRNAQNWMTILSETDAVIATGGGYLTDSFPDHALGLLANLGLAQHLGKPTAFFGQGIGPLTNKSLRKSVSHILESTQIIGLREKVTGPSVLNSLRISPKSTFFTGDDALELINTESRGTEKTHTIGLNIRISDYSGVNEQVLEILSSELKSISINNYKFCPLPIDFVKEKANDEHNAFRTIGGHLCSFYETPKTPNDVIDLAKKCDATITGSYHAALFSLAQGVPVIGIQSNPYYESKFDGLKDIYPQGVLVYNPLQSSKGELSKLLKRSLETPDNERISWLDQSRVLSQKGNQLYRNFLKSANL